VESSASNLSPLDFVLCLLLALKHGFVGTERDLPVDHTPRIKSMRAYEDKISIQFQSSIQKQHTFTWGLKPLLYLTRLTTFIYENVISTESIK